MPSIPILSNGRRNRAGATLNYSNMVPLSGRPDPMLEDPAQPLPGGGGGSAPQFRSTHPTPAGVVDAPTFLGNLTPVSAPPVGSAQRVNAQAARKAAVFSNLAPLPSTDAASAYGSVQASKAARAAYVDEQQNRANDLSGGAYIGRDLANDANTRANDVTGADVAVAGATVRASDTIAPATADEMGARATLNRANADVGIPSLAKEREGVAKLRTAQAETATAGADQNKQALTQSQRENATLRTRVAQLERLVTRPAPKTGLADQLLNDGSSSPAVPLYPVPATSGTTPAAPAPAATDPRFLNLTPLPSGGADVTPRSPAPTSPAAANVTPQYRNLTPTTAPASPTTFQGAMTSSVPIFGPGNVRIASPAAATTQKIGKDQARQLLQEAGGDPNRARQLAQARGLSF